MANENELLEIRTRVTAYKEKIKHSAQKIISALNDPKTDISIDTEKLEILTAVANIGIISGTSKKIAGYSDSLAKAFSLIQLRVNNTEREAVKAFSQSILNQLCATPFDVQQKGKKYDITIPINLDSIFKLKV